MEIIKFILEKSKKIFFISIISGLLSGMAGATLIYFINEMIFNPVHTQLYFIIIIIIFFMSELISQILLTKIFQDSIFDLRLKLLNSITTTSLRVIEKIGNSSLLATLTDDVLVISNAIIGLPISIINLSLIIGSLIYLGLISVEIFLILSTAVLFGMIIYIGITNFSNKFFKNAREDQDILFKHFDTIIKGIKELKLNTEFYTLFIENEYIPTALKYKNANFKGFFYFFTAGSIGRILFFLFIGLIIQLRHSLLIQNEQLVSYVLIVLYIKGSIEWIIGWLPSLRRANIVIEKINNIGLSIKEEKEEFGIQINKFRLKTITEITLNNIKYEYFDTNDVKNYEIGPINLTCTSSQITFIIGGNGSGKSTLAKILAGLYIASEGDLIINKIPLPSELIPQYRQNVTAIFYDYCLFEKVPENNVDRGEIDNLLRELDLYEKVTVRNGRISTITELSQGQQKRLTLVMAYFYNRQIYIFDEWTSDQDSMYKDFFYNKFLEKLKNDNKIIIVISHDDRYFHKADKLIKLEYGRIVSDDIFERSLGNILIKKGIITSNDLSISLDAQKKSNIDEKLGEILIRLSYATPMQIRDALIGQLGIGQILLDYGKINIDQLNKALNEQNQLKQKEKLGEILIRKGFVTHDDIDYALKYHKY